MSDSAYSASVADFLSRDPQELLQILSLYQARRFRTNEQAQLRAWERSIAMLRDALEPLPIAQHGHLILEYPIRRLGKRLDAVLLLPSAIFVLEFKVGADSFTAADRRQVEDYGLDLRDFHAASRAHPIVPILISEHAGPGGQASDLLLPSGVAQVRDASAKTLGSVLLDLVSRMPPPASPLDPLAWEQADYCPVPGIIDAACRLYTHHDVADIRAARADAINLAATSDAILHAVRTAQSEGRKICLFVTGIPGAGKTLCGLNVVFGAEKAAGATFLTGNPTLVHVLREALARSTADGGRGSLRSARQSTKSRIAALPLFRDEYVANPQKQAAEHVAVIDEAQRVWDLDHAVRKSADRPVRLTDSEPGHLLDIMARHEDWAVLVALIGNGQEIHDGEGGLAEWGAALARRPDWHVLASPQALQATDRRQALPALPGMRIEPALHLNVSVRNLGSSAAADWVNAVIESDLPAARAIAAEHFPLPFRLTRDLDHMRLHLRHTARGLRRAGLVGSSGAKRLRADGLGVELPHMDAGAVAHWFLDRWPEDVRASDALEQVATEFSCQGLELDVVGLCWGGDLLRASGGDGWRVREFSGTKWQLRRTPEAVSNRLNTYRVLLTRARYETVIWVPRGDDADRTRLTAELDAVADFLMACGVAELEAPPVQVPSPPDVQLQGQLL